jgi:signal transduction histidine kinase
VELSNFAMTTLDPLVRRLADAVDHLPAAAVVLDGSGQPIRANERARALLGDTVPDRLVRFALASAGAASDEDVALPGGMLARCRASALTRADGAIVGAVLVVTGTRPAGDPPAEDELARRAEQQAALAELSLLALTDDRLPFVFEAAARAAARTPGADLVAVVELAPSGDELVLIAGVGWDEGTVGQVLGGVGSDSVFGAALSAGGPILSADLRGDERFGPSPVLDGHACTAALAVAIEGRDAPFGVLGVFTRDAPGFTPADVSFMQAVARVVSLACEAARAGRRLREIERLRIARELHDGALQGLSHIMAVLMTAAEGGAESEVRPLLWTVYEQIRAAIYDLRLEDEEDRPFADRLRELVAVQRSLAGGLAVAAELAEPEPVLTGPPATEVLRIVGEAVANARRHAGATRIVVRAARHAGRLRIEIADDGRGFDPERRPPVARSTGLRGLRERADLLGGTVEIRSAPRVGTTVVIDVPLEGGSSAWPR